MTMPPPPPPRILLMAPQPFFEWRGSPIRVGFDAQALAESGYAVDLLVMPVGAAKAIPGVTLHRAANFIGATQLPIGPSFSKALLDLGLFTKAYALAKEHRHAVYHGIEEAGLIAAWLGRHFGGKVIFEKHSDPRSYRRGLLRNLIMGLYGRTEEFSIRHADAVIATGPGLVEQARSVAPHKPIHHIFDIPSSLMEAEPAKIRAAREKICRHPEAVLALYVGSFAVYQGIDLMFESFPAAARSNPALQFVVIGGTAAEIAQRKAWLAAQGIEDRVLFPGKVPPDELPNYLAAADILLSPRVAGTNTPLKLLDYLKAGRAIVACDNPANRLILDETTAVLTAPEPAAFAAGITRLSQAADVRRQISEKGQALYRDVYNYTQFKARLAACYAGLLAGPT